MKFNIGNEVTVIGRDAPMAWQKGVLIELHSGSIPYQVKFSDSVSHWYREKDLAPANTWEGIAKDDVVVNRHGDERTVIERLGDIVFLSSVYNPEHSGCRYTIQELQDVGFTLKNAAPSDEVIEIGGKKYRRDEVEERLAELKEVE